MYQAISRNRRKTVVIVMVFFVMIGLFAAALGLMLNNYLLTGGVLIAAVIYASVQYFWASRMVMAMFGARKIEKRDAPQLWNIVENLAITAGMPTPAIYIIEDDAPNAFASGRDPQNALVGVTTGLLAVMTARELNAVMAHEISHIQNQDTRLSMMIFALVLVVSFLADSMLNLARFASVADDDRGIGVTVLILSMAILAIVMPFVAIMLQLSVSREREYLADASGVKLMRDPEGMASALSKLVQYGKPMKKTVTSASSMFLNSPLKSNFLNRLFSTHPPLEDRINRINKELTEL